jgi:hypothetical protein
MLSVPQQQWHLTLRRPGGLVMPLTVRQNLHDDTTSPVHCHACAQPTTCLGLCDNGHVACPDCLHTCVVCGQDVCTACGIQQGHISKEWVCAQCAVTCPTCEHTVLPRHTSACAACGQVICSDCMAECPHCGKRYCPQHTVSCATCGAKRCAEQGLVCHVCDRTVCEVHHLSCPICGAGCCTEHRETCKLCAQPVCSECMHPIGLCDTCLSALSADQIPLPGDLHGISWANRYSWRVGQNSAWSAYYGEHRWVKGMLWAVVVIDGEGKIRRQHRVRAVRGVMDGLRGVLPPRKRIGAARSTAMDAEEHGHDPSL